MVNNVIEITPPSISSNKCKKMILQSASVATPRKPAVKARYMGLLIQESLGEIRFPPKLQTHNLLAHWPSGKELPPHIKDCRVKYDYHVTLIPASIWLKKKVKVNSMEIHFEMNPDEEPIFRPTAYYIFPTTEFVEGNIKVSGKVGVSIQGGFKYVDNFDASGGGEITLAFDYTRKFAKVTAGGLANYQLFWEFREHKGVDPRGDVLMAVVLQRPRNIQEMQIRVLEAKVTFAGGVWSVGEPLKKENVDIPIEFREGPIQ